MPLTHDEADALSTRFLNAGYSNVTAEDVLKDPGLWTASFAEQAEERAKREQAHGDAMEADFEKVERLFGRLGELCSQRSESLAIVDAALERLSA